jgi:hypothetical protein
MTPTEPTVRLRPITAEEFPAFVAVSKAGYAEGIEVHGGQTHEAAQQKAEADFPAVLPLGLEKPATSSSWSRPTASRSAGSRWRSGNWAGGGSSTCTTSRSIRSSRGAGARILGIDRIELNVFGGNEVARGLYRSMGYVETSAQMRKDLA